MTKEVKGEGAGRGVKRPRWLRSRKRDGHEAVKVLIVERQLRGDALTARVGQESNGIKSTVMREKLKTLKKIRRTAKKMTETYKGFDIA